MTTKETGNLGEDIACQFLQRKGFSIIERNYRRKWGEIDIIVKKGNCVRFVEVKAVTRENPPDISREIEWYRPEEQVHTFKLKKIARTAEIYMADREGEEDFQIDVVGVFLDPVRRLARCRFYENVM